MKWMLIWAPIKLIVRKRQPVAGRRGLEFVFSRCTRISAPAPGVAAEQHRRLQIATRQPARTIDLRTFLGEKT